MKILALAFLLGCASAPRPGLVSADGAGESACAPVLPCPEGGGRGGMLAPFAALTAVAVSGAVLLWGHP